MNISKQAVTLGDNNKGQNSSNWIHFCSHAFIVVTEF